MKISRPKLKFLQLPHSVAARIKSVSNKTAADLLLLLCEKTIGFGRGFIDLSYTQIASSLSVGTRTIANAAKILEEKGHIHRERAACRIYRWRIILQEKDILNDPSGTYLTEKGVMIDPSGSCGTTDHDHDEQSIMTHASKDEQLPPLKSDVEPPLVEHSETILKNSSKEEYLKKQQQEDLSNEPTSDETIIESSELAPRSGDDEPLYKFCLRGLKEHGVRQRVARTLCRDYEHALIKSVLDTVPTLSGVENIAGYLVAAIKDGGYEQFKGQKNGRQAPTSGYPGSRSNYAHLTDHNVKSNRHSTVKPETDAPIAYRSVKDTKLEQQALELQTTEKEQEYQNKSQQLKERFQDLSEEIQLRLKLLASVQLSQQLPQTGNREQMLKDPTFQRMANRTVLERFFQWIDDGLDSARALHQLQGSLAS